MQKIIRLYPEPAGEVALEGAYLALDLSKHHHQQTKPLVYANFVQSLDGRIAVPRTHGSDILSVPTSTANSRDWRLFQELAAQADVLLSSGRYLRDWAAGRAQEILQVDDKRFSDLRSWRAERGLVEHPDIAILSESLDFEVPELLQTGGRKALVFTTEKADPGRIEALKPLVSRVVIAGKEGVEGKLLVEALAGMGYRSIYSAAGPRVLHTLLSAQVLDRLYLTVTPMLLGGERFAGILEGSLLEPPIKMRIESVFLDPSAFNGSGQLFLSYLRA